MAKQQPVCRNADFSLLDPSFNVQTMLKNATKRIDDLRTAEIRSLRSEMHLEVKSIRREIKDFKSFIKKINGAETKRIDSIRTTDVGNIALANTAGEVRASTLASQVSDTAIAANTSLKAETDPIRKSIDDLRQSQWTIAGGTAQGQEFRQDTRAKSSNVGLWIGLGAAIFFGLTSMFFSALIVAVTLYLGIRS